MRSQVLILELCGLVDCSLLVAVFVGSLVRGLQWADRQRSAFWIRRENDLDARVLTVVVRGQRWVSRFAQSGFYCS